MQLLNKYEDQVALWKNVKNMKYLKFKKGIENYQSVVIIII